MSWVAVAGVAVSAVGAYTSNQAQKKGAKGQQQGQQAAIDEQRRQYDLSRQDQMPWMQAGSGALGQMQALNGGDFSSFKQSPDYAWALQNGQEGMDRGAAARGRMYSGGYDADRMQFNSGIASQNYGNFYGRLQSMAGQGQTTASGLGTLGASMANNVGNAYGNIGNSKRDSSYNSANIWNNFGQQAVGGMAQAYGQRNAANGGNGGWYMGRKPGPG